MEYNRIRAVIPKPCAKCSRQELNWLRDKHRLSEEAYWVYTIPVFTGCKRCETEPRGVESRDSVFRKYFPGIATMCCPVINAVQVPIPLRTVGLVERAIHAASVAEKGSEYRAHGTFIHHLSMIEEDEETKQALCVWAPAAMGGYMDGQAGVTRRYSAARPVRPAPAITVGGESQDASTAAKPSATEKPPEASSANSSPKTVDCPSMIDHADGRGNPDVQGGAMMGTVLKGDEFGNEERVRNAEHLTELYGPPQEKVMARQIGPDLIPTEVFQSALGNLKCGLAKRVQPLPFKADSKLESKINVIVSKLITTAFNRKKIVEWRENNPFFSEMASKKWSAPRFQNAFNNLLSECIEGRDIAHEFMIKENEALPAKGKAPRPIITSGDEGQVAMLLPVKCFEHLLFKHFKHASIKGVPKHDAMARVAKHLRFKPGRKKSKVTVIEGDGSAWDACCNSRIREMTENRILEHIIEVLGDDAEVPQGWMQQCLRDMKNQKLRGKAKLDEKKLRNPVRVVIDAIRQSGHRGTSAFNWLINFVGWMAVMCEYPQDMVMHNNRGELRINYKSAFDGCTYEIRYAFEGDDSVLTTNEEITPERQAQIEEAWTSMGFRMKLVFGGRKMTFTGFDFLCDELGPTQTFIPELARNIASSSWTTSAEAKAKPEMVHAIGAAAMLARAENFADCGPFSRYFAELGLAHCRVGGDCVLGESSAIALGIAPAESVEQRLNEAAFCAQPMTAEMRELVQLTCKLSHEQEAKLLTCHFGKQWAPSEARHLIPLELWDPGNFQVARRR